MTSKLTIFRKGLILVALPLLFQMTLIGVVAVMQQQAADASHWIAHTKEVLVQAETVLASLADLETGSRGFALTKNPVFTQPFDDALKDVPAALANLKALVSDNADQHSMVEVIAAKATRFIQWHAQRTQDVRDGDRKKAEARITSLEGKKQMDALRRDIAKFRLEEERLDAERTLQWDHLRQTLQWALVVGAIAAVVITLLLAIIFNRGIAARLALLSENAGRLAQGKQLAAPVAGTDEISKVDWAFRDMAQTLTRTQEELRLQAELLELRVLERTRQHQESEQRFRMLATSAPVGIFRCDREGNAVYFNPRCEQILCMTVAEAAQRAWVDILHPDDRERVVTSWAAAVKNGTDFDCECRYVLPHEQVIWVITLAVALRDLAGEVNGFIGTVTDITERKLAEERLQQQLARLHLINQIAQSIGERQDLQSVYRVVLAQLEKNLPVDFNAICSFDPIGNSLHVAAVGPQSRPVNVELGLDEQAFFQVDNNGLGACVRGETIYEPDLTQMDAPIPKKLAQFGLRSLAAAPLALAGKTFGILLTARRALAGYSSSDCEFLRQLSSHIFLAAQHAQLYQELKNAYDDLRHSQKAMLQQERLRALGQMASGIAHDINNAISPISIFTESLLDNEPNLSARAREHLTIIQQAIDDVAHTVSRLRDFYREQEKQLALEPVNLNSLVPQVLDLTRARWRDQSQEHGITINVSTELAPDPPAIMGVESEIRDALTNIIFNAVDAMPHGGRLCISTYTGDREKGDRQNTGLPPTHVILEVADTGIGMDEEIRQRCLEPFFTSKGERGTGLGLAMVYGTMQRHSGDIDIQSAVGTGTRVRLLFPLPQGVVEEQHDVESQVFPSRPLRVLVVDDDLLLRKSLQDALQVDGHWVTTADGGQAGINAFLAANQRSEPFEIVITDLGMPYVDGRAVARFVKEQSPATAVVLLTGWGQRMKTDGEIPAHVDRVLSKPPKLKELRAVLAATANERK